MNKRYIRRKTNRLKRSFRTGVNAPQFFWRKRNIRGSCAGDILCGDPLDRRIFVESVGRCGKCLVTVAVVVFSGDVRERARLFGRSVPRVFWQRKLDAKDLVRSFVPPGYRSNRLQRAHLRYVTNYPEIKAFTAANVTADHPLPRICDWSFWPLCEITSSLIKIPAV